MSFGLALISNVSSNLNPPSLASSMDVIGLRNVNAFGILGHELISPMINNANDGAGLTHCINSVKALLGGLVIDHEAMFSEY